MFNSCGYQYSNKFKTKIMKLTWWLIFYCFIPFSKSFFFFFCILLNYCDTLQALGHLLFFTLSLTSTCIPTWKNVSTCCLGASSLRTGYVHLPIISYIAFIISSISWKVKGAHMRLLALNEETTLTDYSCSVSNFFFFPIKCLLVVPEEKPTVSCLKSSRVRT